MSNTVIYVAIGITIAICLIGLVVTLALRVKPLYPHRNVKFPETRLYLHTLLKRGYRDAFLVLKDTRADSFIQFAKYIRGKGDIGLELGFPRAPWSEKYFHRLQDFLRKREIAHYTHRTHSGAVTGFVMVDCHADIDFAFRLVEHIVRDVFEIQGEVSFEVTFSNVSARDELIDSIEGPR